MINLNPGSPEAIKRGCICPAIDNAHGMGFRGPGVFVVSTDCPLHGALAKKYGTKTPDFDPKPFNDIAKFRDQFQRKSAPDFKAAHDMLDANPVPADSEVLGAGLVELYPGGPKVRVDGK